MRMEEHRLPLRAYKMLLNLDQRGKANWRFTDRCNNQVCQTKHCVYVVLQTGVTTRCVRLDTVCMFCFTDRCNNQVCQTGQSVCVVFHRQV